MKDKKLIFGDFTSWKAFSEYAEIHYLPLLDRLTGEKSPLSPEEKYVLDYLHEDLTAIVNNANEFDSKFEVKGEK